MQTKTIFVRDNQWITGYEAHDMPGSHIRVAYSIEPTRGSDPLKDGEYKGFVLENGILRIVYGGEYYAGNIINHSFLDYKIAFLEDENDEYLAGYKRGFLGKRRASSNYVYNQSAVWRDGYQTAQYHKSHG
jgi:hypothetical protein